MIENGEIPEAKLLTTSESKASFPSYILCQHEAMDSIESIGFYDGIWDTEDSEEKSNHTKHLSAAAADNMASYDDLPVSFGLGDGHILMNMNMKRASLVHDMVQMEMPRQPHRKQSLSHLSTNFTGGPSCHISALSMTSIDDEVSFAHAEQDHENYASNIAGLEWGTGLDSLEAGRHASNHSESSSCRVSALSMTSFDEASFSYSKDGDSFYIEGENNAHISTQRHKRPSIICEESVYAPCRMPRQSSTLRCSDNEVRNIYPARKPIRQESIASIDKASNQSVEYYAKINLRPVRKQMRQTSTASGMDANVAFTKKRSMLQKQVKMPIRQASISSITGKSTCKQLAGFGANIVTSLRRPIRQPSIASINASNH